MGIVCGDVRFCGMTKEPFNSERVSFGGVEHGRKRVAAPVGRGIRDADLLRDRAKVFPVSYRRNSAFILVADDGVTILSHPSQKVRSDMGMHRDNAVFSGPGFQSALQITAAFRVVSKPGKL